MHDAATFTAHSSIVRGDYLNGSGYPIVLTADRTLLSNYELLFDGMLAASQTTTTPKIIMDGLLLPRLPVVQGRAGLAPLGLRRIEAALRQGGFSAEEVIITTGELLGQVVGSATRIIAISSGDPLGRGMNSNTMSAIAGGMGYPEAMFRRLLRQVRRVKDQASASESARGRGGCLAIGGRCGRPGRRWASITW